MSQSGKAARLRVASPGQAVCSVLAASLLIGAPVVLRGAGEFETFLKPLFAEKCTKCHGEEKVKGKINLFEIATEEQLLARPDLIEEVMRVIDANDMPPFDEPVLAEADRTRLLASMKAMLRKAAVSEAPEGVPMRRLNRSQYNNAVVDLFELNRDVFHLQEKLMTRRNDYVAAAATSGSMPDRVEVACLSLTQRGGLQEVRAFPKDLRATHGYDNQANQLTLSPLLLDSFLRLSVSIVESPDFNEETVGIWDRFFAEPAGGNVEAQVRARLGPFLLRAFRSAIDDETLDRYTAYTMRKIDEGFPFTDSMKKAASAVLSSPRFLFRYGATREGDDLFVVASNLSFLLWGSGPDLELLRAAASGELASIDVFERTIDRMLADPRIERFLDTFPSQWMQLENVLGATPHAEKARLFSLDPDHPASLQMVLEPLLLFDAVFLENRPLTELITPEFTYRSEFLKRWYRSDLSPPVVDRDRIVAGNHAKEAKRNELRAAIESTRAELDGLLDPVRSRLLRAKSAGRREPVNLRPTAAWEFNGDLRDSVGSLHLEAHGKVRYQDGMVVLDRAYLQSSGLPVDLKAKTLEVWCKVPDLDQRGGGVMGIQGPGDFFDTIVFGERKRRHWISGSNGFSRTLDFPESFPEEQTDEALHLAMVYREDGTTTLYRNGKPYGKPYRKGAATFPKDKSSVLFGLRHLPPGGNKFLRVSLGRARLYDRALSAEEVAGSSGALVISEEELVKALTPGQRTRKSSLDETLRRAELALQQVPPNLEPNKVQEEAQRRFENDVREMMWASTFERVPVADPRYGGVITNAAMLSMTSGPDRTHPIARGAWIIEVIFNDPPPPPPNDVPPLNEDGSDKNLTIREKFAQHREHPDCAGCHARLDPLGFALENYDIVGRWRDQYENGREIDASGTLMKKYSFDGIVRFKEALVNEDQRFAKAFAAHLLRYAVARELGPKDVLTVDAIVERAKEDDFRLQSLVREVIRSESFLGAN